MLVSKLRDKFDKNEPIFTKEILEIFNNYSRAYVFRLINDAEKKGELICFDTGIYYMPTKTIIGNSTITVDDVIQKKYISNRKEIYGIYSGLSLLNNFSLTTQMPNTIEVVTNKETMRSRKIILDGRTIILHKSRCDINDDNVYAYTLLQLISELKIDEKNNRGIVKKIKQYMIDNKILIKDIITLAKVFPAQTTKKLIYSGVLDEITQ